MISATISFIKHGKMYYVTIFLKIILINDYSRNYWPTANSLALS